MIAATAPPSSPSRLHTRTCALPCEIRHPSPSPSPPECASPLLSVVSPPLLPPGGGAHFTAYTLFFDPQPCSYSSPSHSFTTTSSSYNHGSIPPPPPMPHLAHGRLPVAHPTAHLDFRQLRIVRLSRVLADAQRVASQPKSLCGGDYVTVGGRHPRQVPAFVQIDLPGRPSTDFEEFIEFAEQNTEFREDIEFEGNCHPYTLVLMPGAVIEPFSPV